MADGDDLESMLYMLTEGDFISPYLNVAGDVIWLSRNYISPRGSRIYDRGLSEIPETTHIRRFEGKARLPKADWILLDPKDC